MDCLRQRNQSFTCNQRPTAVAHGASILMRDRDSSSPEVTHVLKVFSEFRYIPHYC